MPPIRNHESIEVAESSWKARLASKHPRKRQKNVERAANAVPGTQKIKAALRQTRRLLAKDNLAADVRVETERRFKALEADLHEAESAKKERALAVRYHKVKFFERQKVTRKIKQAQKRLILAEGKAQKQKTAKELYELRVDLNYIIHYPKMKKYISLFPPEVRKGEGVSPVSRAEEQKTSVEREQIRDWMMQQMERGELASEPELEVRSRIERKRAGTYKRPTDEKEASPSKLGPSKANRADNEDDFFEDDEEELDEDSS